MNAVRDLQHMLRLLSTRYPQIPTIAADGVFGEQTLEAVMVFQRDFGLPVTGVADRITWEAMVRQAGRITGGAPFPLPRYLDAPSPSDFDDPETLRSVARFMFNALSGVLHGFVRSAPQNPAFEENIRTLQRAGGLPVTGALDAATWLKLLRLFQVFVIRVKRGL